MLTEQSGFPSNPFSFLTVSASARRCPSAPGVVSQAIEFMAPSSVLLALESGYPRCTTCLPCFSHVSSHVFAPCHMPTPPWWTNHSMAI